MHWGRENPRVSWWTDRLIWIINNPGLHVVLSGPLQRFCSDEPEFKLVLSHLLVTESLNL